MLQLFYGSWIDCCPSNFTRGSGEDTSYESDQARRSITLHFLLGLREKGKRNNNICLLRVKANGALNARLLRRKGRWDYIRDLCRHSCDWVHISLSLSLSLSLFLFLSLLFIFSINRTSYHHGIHYLRGFTKLGGNRSRVMLRQRKEVLNQHFYTFWVVF